MTTESLTIADLRETCPLCGGTGLEASPPSSGHNDGFGRRVVARFPAACNQPLCKNGKVPTEFGRLILDLVRDYR
jgi:hypothetical protein